MRHLETPKRATKFGRRMLSLGLVILVVGGIVRWWQSPSTQTTDTSPEAQAHSRVLCAKSLPGNGCHKLKIVRMDANGIEFHQIAPDGWVAVYRGVWKPGTRTHPEHYAGNVSVRGELYGEFVVQMDNHSTGEGWVQPAKEDGYDEKFSIQPQAF